ncbi:carbohydrate ABC transporter permease [Arthrobacter glacialis]|uniref:ABC transmembrane type-1 domain-containing protein n=1 Tax=Arthrobacter glacialis TaxID=1664 RepID=A0A2S3ZV75_ARTGL|nr:sugar ABC transporter permease [Arthrobacter glacialis]POH73120.1 hypothetical protein CVS27_11330 [Arthrobacter glacialis]
MSITERQNKYDVAHTPGNSKAQPVRRRKMRKANSPWIGVALMAPTMLWVGGTLVFAVVLLLSLSLRDVGLGPLDKVLAAPLSLVNYAEVLTNADTWRSFGISVVYVAGSTAIPFAIGLGTALLLNQKMPGQRLLRTLVLVPWAVPGVTATIAFMWMMAPTYGVVNYILRTLGIISTDINWFADDSLALLAVIAPTSWKAFPFFTLMLLAGLQSVGKEQYEAASMDGAGKLLKFRYVTLPALSPFIFISVIFNMMYAFREFDFIYASTRGGPAGATETIAVRIYNQAFERFDLGSAAALGILTFALIGAVVFFLVRKKFKGSLEGVL